MSKRNPVNKYHINKHGEPAICDALFNCPLGGEDNHIETNDIKVAKKFAEQKNAQSQPTIPKSKSTAKEKKESSKQASSVDIFQKKKQEFLEADKERVRGIIEKGGIKKVQDKETKQFLQDKIDFQVSNFGFTEEEVIDEIFNGSFLSAYNILRKPTEKQGYQEKALIEHLGKSNYFRQIRNLPNNGTSKETGEIAKYIRKGKLTEKKPANSLERTIKSLDFQTETTNGTNVYGIAKHTTTSGGSQDNQHNDVIAALNETTGFKEGIVVAVLDGSFWENRKRRESLKDSYKDYPHIVITDHKNVEKDVKAAEKSLSSRSSSQ